MSYFREHNADDFDNACAEDDARREAREPGNQLLVTERSSADRARIRADLDKARRILAEKTRIDREEYQAGQDRLRLEEKAAHAYVRAMDWLYGPFAGAGDQRDLTPEPPAYLDPVSVLNMRGMVQDAVTHGDRPWPYRWAQA